MTEHALDALGCQVRNAAMFNAYLRGDTMAELSRFYRVSPGRVSEILRREGIRRERAARWQKLVAKFGVARSNA